MVASNLQDKLDSLRPGDTLKLDSAKEFQGPLTIRQPVVIEGQGGTIWAPRGPVLIIDADGVRLHALNVEVTSNDAAAEGEASCALRVLAGKSVTLDQVSVRGTVSGLDTEEGEWGYPRSIALGSLNPGQAHEFMARLMLPVPCRVVSKIDGLTVDPQQTRGGLVEVTLKVAPLAAGTLVRGEIWLQTALLTRRIAIHGNVLKTAAATAPGNGQVVYTPPDPSQRTVPIGSRPAGAPADGLPDPGLTIPITDQSLPVPAAAPAFLVVSPRPGEGQYQTLTEALRHAPTGGRIRVRPGRYKESLVLDRRVEILGDGACPDIVVEGQGAACLEMRTDFAVVRGLTLRVSDAGARPCPAVAIADGQLILEDCDISSASLAGVAVRGVAAAPILRRCRIHDGASAGVLFYDRAEGTLEDCEIFANAHAGVEIRESANPSLRRCKIHGGRQAGLLVHLDGKGILEGCELYDNALAAVEIARGGDPVLRRCTLRDGRYPGLLVREHGRGTADDCDIAGNALAGVEVREGGKPTVRRCRIRDNKQGGLHFTQQAEGTVEDCEITGNAVAGVVVRRRSTPTLRRCRVHHCGETGILFAEQARGTVEECEVVGSGWAGVAIFSEADPVVSHCKIRDGKGAGLVAARKGAGTVRECEVSGNGFAGLVIAAGAAPVVRRCRITKNGDTAVWAYEKAAGEVEDCDLTGNARGAADVARGCPVVLKGNKQ